MAADNKLLAQFDLVGIRALVEPPQHLRSSGATGSTHRAKKMSNINVPLRIDHFPR